MKNKFELCFVLSHLKRAIWNLECANKLKEGTIDQKVIDDLKTEVILLKNQEDEGNEE